MSPAPPPDYPPSVGLPAIPAGAAVATPPARRPSAPDLAVGAGVLALGGLALWQSALIPQPAYGQVGPAFVPWLVGAMVTALGALLCAAALRGGWSAGLEDVRDAPPGNVRAFGLLLAGLAVNLALIGPLGFSLASSAQFVLTAAAFGSRRPLRDALIALALTLTAWFVFVRVLGVNIGAGLLERLVGAPFGLLPPE